MLNRTEDLELRPILRKLFYRGILAIFALLVGSIISSMAARNSMQKELAEHVSQTVRNDLLIGNNNVVLKTLKQHIPQNFKQITYFDGRIPLFTLDSKTGSDHSFIEGTSRVPICLRHDQKDCSSILVFHYTLLHYLPLLLLTASVALTIFILVFWIFRQHVVSYYRAEIKNHKEAALGRLSARICHDLKLPCMIFQRVAYLDRTEQFLELRPQLQSHLRRLYAMIEKLKVADIEGMMRMETHSIKEKDLGGFLASIAPTPQQLQLRMRPELRLYLDLEKFERSLANLVLNAFQAGAAKVEVQLRDEGHDLIVWVENDGPKIPDELVQSFLRTDQNRLDSSLGLRIVRDTVIAHGGSFDLMSNPQWTRFILRFPNCVIVQQETLLEPKITTTFYSKAERPSTSEALVWMDQELVPVALNHISRTDREPFHFTSEAHTLQLAQLLVSRHEELVDAAINHSIPLILAGASTNDFAWIDALRSRLRLLRLQQSQRLSQ